MACFLGGPASTRPAPSHAPPNAPLLRGNGIVDLSQRSTLIRSVQAINVAIHDNALLINSKADLSSESLHFGPDARHALP